MTTRRTVTAVSLLVLLVCLHTDGRGQITVRLPDILCDSGSTVIVPLTVSSTGGTGILSFQADIFVDSSIASIQSLETVGTLAAQEGWTVLANNSGDSIRIGAFGSSPLTGSGTLFNLRIKGLGSRGSSTAIRFSRFFFNAGSPGVLASDGVFRVFPPAKPPEVALVAPASFTNIGRDTVAFSWRAVYPPPRHYWFEWTAAATFDNAMADSTLTDTLMRKAGFPRGTTISWRVRAGNEGGWGPFSETRAFTTSITSVEPVEVPSGVYLGPNFPNPFNPATTITFRIPASTHVRLDVHNAAGELVQVMADGFLTPGEHQISFSGADLPSGTYYARMQAGPTTMIRTMLLLK
jgi:hypothetical protein